ncbi:UNVERIFIED_CONTAM: hypothetical protein FKN15_023442 [Acipenser sinensis]
MDEEETRRNKVSKQMKGTVNLEDNVDRGSPQTTTSSSDENENQIQGSVSGHRQARQDCVNNNETDPHSKIGDSRDLSQGLNNETDPHSKTGDPNSLAQGLKNNNKAANCSDTQSANTEGVKGNGTSPKRNGKHKKGMKAESSGVVPEACTAVMLDGISNGPQGPSEEEEEEEDFLEVSTSCQQKIDKISLLQSLFSSLQGHIGTDSLFTKSTDGDGSCFQPAAEELPEDMLTDAETSEQQGEGVGEELSKTAQKKPVPRQVCPEQQAGGVQCDSSASGEQAGEGNHLAEEVKVKGKGLLSSPPREESKDISESAAAGNEALQSEHMSEPGELEGQGGGEEEEKEELSLEEGEADLESEDGLKATGRAEEVEETGSPDRDVASSTGGSVAESERDTSPHGSLDAWGLDDSTPSLDDLAKRIEIEEITPAEGLVSILKRRGSLDAAEIPPVKVKGGAKRRVRFQETDDMLDQDEVGMDSCLLLVLLCVVTVFISVGGTALYCTFGDVESSICTDFSNNVDFYFTQMQQRIQELKRWLSPGS